MQLVERLAGDDLIPLQRFLLSSKDKYVRAETARLLATRDSAEAAASRGLAWRQELVLLCRKAGLDFDALALPQSLADAPGLKTLNQRELKGLSYWLQVDPSLTALDVQPSTPRMCRAHNGVLNTLVPNSQYVLLKEKRRLLGLEMMRLQGFPLDVMVSAQEENVLPQTVLDPFWADLAGNAFSGPVVLAIHLAIYCSLQPAHIQAFGGSVDASAGGSEDDMLREILG